MATLVLSAVGGAVGASVGGSVLGLSAVVIGRAIGATVGRAIDQKLLGSSGSSAVERGQVENFRVMGSREGAAIPRVFGAMRVAGQIIWSTGFDEHVEDVVEENGTVAQYRYTLSLAVALCEGKITRIGKIWADGQELDTSNITRRVYRGGEGQQPDQLIEAIKGVDDAPAYRGTAYVVFENLDVTQFGNRIPQFNFEVYRQPESLEIDEPKSASTLVKGVAMVPGTGEYSLATKPITYEYGKGVSKVANVNGLGGKTDFARSVLNLNDDVPNCGSISLVVSWFGSDLRCGECQLEPAVEQSEFEGDAMTWGVSGQDRTVAKVLDKVDGRSIFGGTPADKSVIQAIKHTHFKGHEVMFYPFILMDILGNNGLPDPWSDANDQPLVPWRGRITTSKAAGLLGSPDETAVASNEVAAFFGTAAVGDFIPHSDGVDYSGPAEWSYRRFILHYAHLCVKAGGVESFCIGSEMRALLQIRDGVDSFPAVAAMVQLVADVRTIVGPDCKIGYAADWSEYFGYQPDDGSGDVFYHLDPLWSDDNIDFIGIDNYMPLSDWRDGPEHADQDYESLYNLEYLQSNIEGGEGFDWYYENAANRLAQVRTPITDGGYSEPWVYRYKDIKNWWNKQHHQRVGGVRAQNPSDWLPESKPIWFTEIGCPAVDKGTNQPNVFHDPKSSESAFPRFSNGNRDDLIQHRYLQAFISYWEDDANNPKAAHYDGRMIDTEHTHVWAWDARPYPEFPDRLDVWSDGGQFARGHWVSGRINMASLAEVVSEICRRSNLDFVDVSKLYGLVKGFIIGDAESARQSLQPLMLAYGFDCFDVDGTLVFRNRNRSVSTVVTPENLALDNDESISLTRSPDAETVGRLQVGFIDPDKAYQSGAAEHVFPNIGEAVSSQTNLPLVLSASEGQAIAERWLTEARVARDEVSFTLPPSVAEVGAGDIVSLPHKGRVSLYRIDRIEDGTVRKVSGTRIEKDVYAAKFREITTRSSTTLVQYGPLYSEFLDLPLLTGSEVPHSFHIAVTGSPWPGRSAVYSSSADSGYRLNRLLNRSATMGETLDVLSVGQAGRWQNVSVRVKIASGVLQSISAIDVLNGGNRAAIRFGGSGDWEVVQFRDAELVGDREYKLSGLLRGQFGTEFTMPNEWPVGTDFVLLDVALTQVEIASNERGLDRHYRVGNANLPYADDSYSHRIFAGLGVGLRPYAPAHLKTENIGGDLQVDWVRRTRIDGDLWQNVEVPLGEYREAYLVRVLHGLTVLREVEVATSEFTYTSAMQVFDGAAGQIEIEVAQISDHFGAGPFIRRTANV